MLSPSVPKTPDPFNSPFRARSPEGSSVSNSPQNVGSVGQNLGPGAYIPRDKGSMVKLIFFLKMANGEIKKFFLDLSSELSVFSIFVVVEEDPKA